MPIVRELPETIWRDYLQQHPQANIFHTPEMYQVFARAQGYRPQFWAAVDATGWPLALFLPVEVTLFGGPLRPLTTRAILYGSLLCTPGPEGERALAELLRAYRRAARGRALYTELRHLADQSALHPLLAAQGFTHEGHLNYLIDLDRPVEAIMESIGARTRKNIRRALRDEQLRVVEVTGRDQVASVYQLLQQTYAAAQVPLAHPSLFEAAFDILYPQNMVKFILIQVGEACAAGSVELLFKDTIYGWYGGLDRAYSRHSPNELLTWSILSWGATHGYKVYDFGGAGKPEEEYGVREFKAKFGGTLVNFGRSTWIHNPALFRLSSWGYELYRRRFSRRQPGGEEIQT